ncbi:MAG: SUMF1/EgtB/PvdO family nonheme iron enzyme [bacterium]|nr:SUMF1/EgtB/PvdO family nonheme iron enzyme [bacterium]
MRGTNRWILSLVLLSLGCAAHGSPPPKLRIRPLDDHRAEITWIGVARNWKLDRERDAEAFVMLARLDSSQKIWYDTTLAPGHLFTYRLSATGLDGTDIAVTDTVRMFLYPPAIAGIRAVNSESAIVWWDTVDAAAANVRVLRREQEWETWTAVSEVHAQRGWSMLANLDVRRKYQFRLQSVSNHGVSSYGQIVEYTHHAPVLQWVFLPRTEFAMGSFLGDESPVHKVALSPYLLSQHEITNGDYIESCYGDSVPLPEDPDFASMPGYCLNYPGFPIVNVSWYDAVRFCNWLSHKAGLPAAYDADGRLVSKEGIRLPTEAEWEHAARFQQADYPWGDANPDLRRARFGEVAVEKRGAKGPVAVGRYPASPPGLYDLAGNVWEWCNDWYGPFAKSDSTVGDPFGPRTGWSKGIRGGSWADMATTLRGSNRDRLDPALSLATVGFRVAQSVPVNVLVTINRRWIENEELSH